MYKTIVDYLRETSEKYPKKIAFTNNKDEINWSNFYIDVKKTATSITSKNYFNKPIAILLDKEINSLISMLGVVASGNYYTILDVKSPVERLQSIIDTLDPACIITSNKYSKVLEKLNFKNEIIDIDKEKENSIIDDALLYEVNKNIIDTNPMYILFTSGSTGIPKGTVLSHKAVLSYINWFVSCFDINSKTVFGSQTPFYFSMSVSDIFSTIVTGATFHIIPKMYFSFPIKLLEFLNEKNINTIYWVPSALCIVANMRALDAVELPDLKKVLFAGEVMPTKQLNMWMDKVHAEFANLYGPTETVDICTYYKINRSISNEESIPIGHSCDNCDILILKEDNTLALQGEEGELCVRGSFLANGYYKSFEKTKSVFVQNPLNNNYPEIIYRTGDIVKLNDLGEIIYISRKDYQIKHMGYRIELGEIENKISSIDGIILCCCIYDEDTDKIILYYQSNELYDIILIEQAKSKLPKYMVPNVVIKIDRMPYNQNGKIDRKSLKEKYRNRG
ncbi:MAG: AMP-binding protein [bacterium]|nr:AMP-binding protein [bacterium]